MILIPTIFVCSLIISFFLLRSFTDRLYNACSPSPFGNHRLGFETNKRTLFFFSTNVISDSIICESRLSFTCDNSSSPILLSTLNLISTSATSSLIDIVLNIIFSI